MDSFSDPGLTQVTLQNEILQSNASYNEKSRQLHANLERCKQQRANNRSRIVCVPRVRVESTLTLISVKATVGHFILRD